jgi:hypothetical protein
MAEDQRNRRFRIRPGSVAMVTAVAAIALGVWDSAQNRRHNRLSVSPYLVCDYSIAATPGSTTFVINLSNEGIGPAIIRSVEIQLPDALGGGRSNEWGPVVAVLRERGVTVQNYWNFEGGEALGVQKSQELLRAIVASSDRSDDILQQLGAIQVQVQYASVYGDVRQARLN